MSPHLYKLWASGSSTSDHALEAHSRMSDLGRQRT